MTARPSINNLRNAQDCRSSPTFGMLSKIRFPNVSFKTRFAPQKSSSPSQSVDPPMSLDFTPPKDRTNSTIGLASGQVGTVSFPVFSSKNPRKSAKGSCNRASTRSESTQYRTIHKPRSKELKETSHQRVGRGVIYPLLGIFASISQTRAFFWPRRVVNPAPDPKPGARRRHRDGNLKQKESQVKFGWA